LSGGKTASGGAGGMRGGLGLERALEGWQDVVLYTGLGDRHKFHPWGLAGGQEGGAGAFYRVSVEDGSVTQMGHKTTSLPLKKGDVIRVITPGAGGYGDPKRRPVEQVLRDVTEGKISLSAAKDQYGVVIRMDGIHYSVDEQATAALRSA
ncbi:MAG: hydantoinase B/oxoprolinase family protein, partial [Lawsonibacter sp.]